MPLSSRIAFCLLCLALVPAPTMAATEHAAKRAPEKTAISPALRAEIAAVNRLRKAQALSEVRADAGLAKVAEFQARGMAAKQLMSHDAVGDFTQRVRAGGVEFARAGENLGEGYENFASMLEGWMRSDGHRRNLLMEKAARIGIASARDTKGRLYWALVLATPEEKPAMLGDPGPRTSVRWGNASPFPFGLTFGQ